MNHDKSVMSLADWVLAICISAVICVVAGIWMVSYMVKQDKAAKCEVQRDIVVYETCMALPKDVKSAK